MGEDQKEFKIGPEYKEETKSGADPVGSQNTMGGWGLPAGEDDRCPECGSDGYHYVPDYMTIARNICPDCKHCDTFLY